MSPANLQPPLVTVTSSSRRHHELWRALQRTPDQFCTSDEVGAWVMLDFGDRAISPKKYTLRHWRTVRLQARR